MKRLIMLVATMIMACNCQLVLAEQASKLLGSAIVTYEIQNNPEVIVTAIPGRIYNGGVDAALLNIENKGYAELKMISFHSDEMDRYGRLAMRNNLEENTLPVELLSSGRPLEYKENIGALIYPYTIAMNQKASFVLRPLREIHGLKPGVYSNRITVKTYEQ